MYGNWIPASRTGRLNCKNSARQENIRTHGLLLTSTLPLSPTTTNRAPCFVYTPFSIKTRMLLSTFFSIMLTRSSHVFDLAAVQSNDVWGRTNKLTPHPTPQFIRLDTNPTPLRYVDQSGSKNLPEQDEGRWGEGSIYFSQIIDAMFWTTKLVLSCFGTIHEIQREAHTQKNPLSPCWCCRFRFAVIIDESWGEDWIVMLYPSFVTCRENLPGVLRRLYCLFIDSSTTQNNLNEDSGNLTRFLQGGSLYSFKPFGQNEMSRRGRSENGSEFSREVMRFLSKATVWPGYRSVPLGAKSEWRWPGWPCVHMRNLTEIKGAPNVRWRHMNWFLSCLWS